MYTLTLPILLAASSFAFAGSHSHDHSGHDHSGHDQGSHEQHALASHVHGMASLDVVLEGTMLLASLKVPAADIVGFEHKASTHDQKNKVYDMLAKMERPETLWTLPAAAECESQDVHVEHDLLEDDHDHHGHDHGDHHDDAHSDILVDYHYECQQPEHLDTLHVNLFEHYPTVNEVHGQLITPSGQQGQTLNAGQNIIRLNE